MKSYVVVFLSVLLAEMGDKTQLATLVFATNPAVSKLGVFAASAGALLTSTALAVVIGAQIGTWVPPAHFRVIAALGFIAIGVWMLVARD